MKTSTIAAIAFAMLAVSSCKTAQVSSQLTPIEGDQYTLTMGDATMTISAAEGGKIMSYKLGDKEMIAQLKRPNQYGSTFWTSPQVEWNWPPVAEFDTRAYEKISETGTLVLKSSVAAKLPFSIQKEYKANTKKGCIDITYSIKNEGDAARKVAPWEISRVISTETGQIFFEADAADIEPADLLPFTFEEGAAWYTFESARQNRKINADGEGWLAYTDDGMLMIKKFDNLDKAQAQPAPGEAEIQVYVNMGKSYIELESQGAYKELQPGESLQWTVSWYLLPVSPDASKADLIKAVKQALK